MPTKLPLLRSQKKETRNTMKRRREQKGWIDTERERERL